MTFKADVQQHEYDIAEIKTQRDELLAALKTVIQWHERQAEREGARFEAPFWEVARAAIARPGRQTLAKSQTWPQQKADICFAAGHAWEKKHDQYGMWQECARCGAKQPAGLSRG